MHKTGSGLFDLPAPRRIRGRVRRGLDAEIAAATVELPAAGVAVLRSMADQIDQLERWCSTPEAKPYDRVPLTGLFHQWEETYSRVFAAVTLAEDPLTAELARFTSTQTGDLEESPRTD